jgi:hypothetical protein
MIPSPASTKLRQKVIKTSSATDINEWIESGWTLKGIYPMSASVTASHGTHVLQGDCMVWFEKTEIVNK